MTKKKMINSIDQIIRRFWIPLTILLLLIILFLSLYPLPQLPMMSSGADKFYHFIAYLFLALPVAYTQPKLTVWYLLGMVFLSGSIELIQPYVNRYGEWLDFLANTLGIFMGFVIGRLSRLFIKNKTRVS